MSILTRFVDDVENIQKLSNHPNLNEGLTAAQLKQRFDMAGMDVKEFINYTLIPELESNLQALPASQTVITEITGLSATSVQAALEEIWGQVSINETEIANNLSYINGLTLDVSDLWDALALKADKSNVLELDNVASYTPTLSYHPATKKYVDDADNQIYSYVDAKAAQLTSDINQLELDITAEYMQAIEDAQFSGVDLSNTIQVWQDPAVEITVGPNGDFPTISEALTYATKFRPAHQQGDTVTYNPPTTKVLITVQADCIITERIVVDGEDLSYITMMSDGYPVVDFSGYPGGGTYSLFAFYNAKTPYFYNFDVVFTPYVDQAYSSPDEGLGQVDYRTMPYTRAIYAYQSECNWDWFGVENVVEVAYFSHCTGNFTIDALEYGMEVVDGYPDYIGGGVEFYECDMFASVRVQRYNSDPGTNKSIGVKVTGSRLQLGGGWSFGNGIGMYVDWSSIVHSDGFELTENTFGSLYIRDSSEFSGYSTSFGYKRGANVDYCIHATLGAKVNLTFAEFYGPTSAGVVAQKNAKVVLNDCDFNDGISNYVAAADQGGEIYLETCGIEYDKDTGLPLSDDVILASNTSVIYVRNAVTRELTHSLHKNTDTIYTALDNSIIYTFNGNYFGPDYTGSIGTATGIDNAVMLAAIEDRTITVGIDGDVLNLSDAFELATKLRPYFVNDAGVWDGKITIIMKAGYVLNEQLSFRGDDLGHIVLLAEDDVHVDSSLFGTGKRSVFEFMDNSVSFDSNVYYIADNIPKQVYNSPPANEPSVGSMTKLRLIYASESTVKMTSFGCENFVYGLYAYNSEIVVDYIDTYNMGYEIIDYSSEEPYVTDMAGISPYYAYYGDGYSLGMYDSTFRGYISVYTPYTNPQWLPQKDAVYGVKATNSRLEFIGGFIEDVSVGMYFDVCDVVVADYLTFADCTIGQVYLDNATHLIGKFSYIGSGGDFDDPTLHISKWCLMVDHSSTAKLKEGKIVSGEKGMWVRRGSTLHASKTLIHNTKEYAILAEDGATIHLSDVRSGDMETETTSFGGDTDRPVLARNNSVIYNGPFELNFPYGQHIWSFQANDTSVIYSYDQAYYGSLRIENGMTPGSGDLTYIHDQQTAASVWTVTHNLGKYPSVTVVDSGGNVAVGDIAYTDNNSLTITFSAAFAGKAYIN